MISHDEIVGRRIANVLGDSSLSDEHGNFCDFLYIADNNVCFRMPCDRDDDDLLPKVEPDFRHRLVDWPANSPVNYRQTLWAAEIVDIIVPTDREKRLPDSGLIRLSSGWYVAQMSYGPIGIMPWVAVIDKLKDDKPMISVWDAVP